MCRQPARYRLAHSVEPTRKKVVRIGNDDEACRLRLLGDKTRYGVRRAELVSVTLHEELRLAPAVERFSGR